MESKTKRERPPSNGSAKRVRAKCEHDGCTNNAQKGVVCVVARCSHEGCTKIVRNKGVCISHGGATPTRKTCKHEGCANHVVKGGVCWRHGAKLTCKSRTRTCSHDGCTNHIVKGGVCVQHGAKVKRRSRSKKTCEHEGCTNHVVRGGVCWRHIKNGGSDNEGGEEKKDDDTQEEVQAACPELPESADEVLSSSEQSMETREITSSEPSDKDASSSSTTTEPTDMEELSAEFNPSQAAATTKPKGADPSPTQVVSLVDSLYLAADKDKITVGGINRSIASHFGLKKVKGERKRMIKRRLTDLVTGEVVLGGEKENEGASAGAKRKHEGRIDQAKKGEVGSTHDGAKKSDQTCSLEGCKDTSKDVLHAKGGAAQTMSNPGNLYFYALCETRYDEFAKLATHECVKHPQRRIIAGQIVDAVLATGGVFRTIHGGVMTRSASIDKARDRLRQIGKPKLRPTGFGPNDVVSVRGGAVHFYSGNNKWYELLEGFVLSYFRDAVAAAAANTTPTALLRQACTPKQRRNTKGKFVKLRKGEEPPRLRPSYQYEIVNETIRIIHERGGKFLWEDLKELTHEEISAKTHSRFKGFKKELIAGTRTFVPHDAGNDAFMKKGGCCNMNDALDNPLKTVEEKDGASRSANTSSSLWRSEIIKNRSGGFTSVKAVVSRGCVDKEDPQQSPHNRKRAGLEQDNNLPLTDEMNSTSDGIDKDSEQPNNRQKQSGPEQDENIASSDNSYGNANAIVLVRGLDNSGPVEGGKKTGEQPKFVDQDEKPKEINELEQGLEEANTKILSLESKVVDLTEEEVNCINNDISIAGFPLSPSCGGEHPNSVEALLAKVKEEVTAAADRKMAAVALTAEAEVFLLKGVKQEVMEEADRKVAVAEEKLSKVMTAHKKQVKAHKKQVKAHKKQEKALKKQVKALKKQIDAQNEELDLVRSCL